MRTSTKKKAGTRARTKARGKAQTLHMQAPADIEACIEAKAEELSADVCTPLKDIRASRAKRAKELDLGTASALYFLNLVPADAKRNLFMLCSNDDLYLNMGRLGQIGDAVKFGKNLLDGDVRGDLLNLIDYVRYHAEEKAIRSRRPGRVVDAKMCPCFDLILELVEKCKVPRKNAVSLIAEWTKKKPAAVQRSLNNYKRSLGERRFPPPEKLVCLAYRIVTSSEWKKSS